MEEKELNGDSHIYHYAKGKYLTSKNPFNDLRKIYAIRNGCKAEYITDKDILDMMLTLVYQHIQSEHAFKEFVCNMFKTYKHRAMLPHFGIANKKKLLRQILITLALTKVWDNGKVLIPLDEPNFTILPSHAEWADKKLLRWAKSSKMIIF